MNFDSHPFISSNQNQREFSVASILIGVILSVVFGAANAYLGLRIGMTISASIPASVISMIILRVLLRRQSILENNMAQTIASAGESMAAGVIFTVPVFALWSQEGVTKPQPFSTITLLALFGGVLGVLFMIPLRHFLVKTEHERLLFPEGRACAVVLLSAENKAQNGSAIFIGAILGAVSKLLIDGLRLCSSAVVVPVKKLQTIFAMEPYPALLGVGYICGLKVSATLFAGSFLSWFVLIPLIVKFGGENVIAPGSSTIASIYEQGGAPAIWSTYIRYIGAGAVACGGITGLIKAMPLIGASLAGAFKGLKAGDKEDARTDKDLDNRLLVAGIVLVLVLLAALPQIPLNCFGVLLFAVCGFCFSLVASRIVGIIGASNSPCSGMTIAALLIAASILKRTSLSPTEGMIAAMAIATMCCIITTIAGDTSQDLKTGFLLGATPQKQQIGEIIGVLGAACCVGGVVLLLDKAWGFGSEQLPAPQAHLMKLVVEGVMQDTMSWDLLLVGAAISLTMELLGIPSLGVAIGVFLPMASTAPILIGGLLKHMIDGKNEPSERGVLLCSGLIAGEGIMGILLALLAVLHWDDCINLSNHYSTGMAGSLVLLTITILIIWKTIRRRNPN